MRQLIVNACCFSDVAFTLLASFRGLAVSPRASFERLTLYHSRVLKQAVIFRVVLRSRPDLRCIKSHRRSPLPFSARRRAALSPRVCNLYSAQRSIYSTLPDCRTNPKRRSARRGMRRALRTQAFRGILLACCSVTLRAGSICVRGMLAQRMESSGEPRQIQPVRGDAAARTDRGASESLIGYFLPV